MDNRTSGESALVRESQARTKPDTDRISKTSVNPEFGSGLVCAPREQSSQAQNKADSQAQSKADEDDRVYVELASSTTIAPATKRNYAMHLRRIQRICGDSWSLLKSRVSIKDIVMQPSRTMSAITRDIDAKKTSVASLSQLVLAIKAVLNHASCALDLDPGVSLDKLKKQWSRIHTPIDAKVKALRLTGIPSRHQLEAVLDWGQVYDNNLRLRDRVKSQESLESLDDLILSDFYVLLEPRRVQDYTRLFVLMEKDTEIPPDATGHVDMTRKHPTITVVAFKTVKHTGPWTRRLPKQLVDDLKLSLRVSPRSYVFVSMNSKPYKSPDTFAAYQRARLLSWFGVPATTTTLRHSRATQVIADPTLSLKEKEAIAYDMAHSLKMHMQYAYKPSREIDGSFQITIFDPVLKRYVPYSCMRSTTPP